MPLDFPTSPTNGQYYNGFVWNDANQTWDSSYAPRAATIPITSPNYIINGAFDIWQRGTSVATGAFTYRADRWVVDQAVTVSRSTDVPAGIEAGYSMLIPAGTGAATTRQAIELPGTSLAGVFSEGKTFTLSFYAKSTASRDIRLSASFRNGVVGTNYLTVINDVSIGTSTSSWNRFTYTFTIPTGSITGANCLPIVITAAAGSSSDVYITGVQVEEGAAATEFRRNSPSIQAELAACQRYYYRKIADTAYSIFGTGFASAATGMFAYIQFPVPMRSAVSTTVDWTGTAGNYQIWVAGGGNAVTAAPVLDAIYASSSGAAVSFTTAGGLTAGQSVIVRALNNLNAYLGFSAEL